MLAIAQVQSTSALGMLREGRSKLLDKGRQEKATNTQFIKPLAIVEDIMASKKSFRNPNPEDGSIDSTLRNNVENFIKSLTSSFKGQVKTYKCPLKDCPKTGIHAEDILEHYQKIHQGKSYGTVLCPEGCSHPYATSAAMRRHRLRVHGNNHATCPVAGCQDKQVRERGHIFKHLRAAHSCPIPAARGFPVRKWYVRAQRTLENWAKAPGRGLDDDYKDMFLISTQRAAQEDEQEDESEQDNDDDDLVSGPITNLHDFLRQLFAAPDQLKATDVAHLKGFSVSNPDFARFITAMSAVSEPARVAIKCLLLTAVIDWIETEEPDSSIGELFQADAKVAEKLSTGDPELEEGQLIRYESGKGTLYDVIYGLYIRGLFGKDKTSFVMRDYSNVICMLGGEEEKAAVKTHKPGLSSKVESAIPEEKSQLEFWNDVLLEALRQWLVDFGTGTSTFYGILEDKIGKKLGKMPKE
ncbi:uncharacterized protein MYCFIDRAFT_179491 [Pseudocercospora fijiensis CIRAD86]|uniref:C2H2-type domain-containing protein n=1 Tax=Pseudocercospora fijiensis (strain CIRAD86) TaxID=383855 RepID=M3ALL1_PSEFD|nr:uncharacterized protein MYCFIDRAFT_179491 [Pseudocercospora fijiensis CIRAD86]EME78043.1 hypothetical protein MYCFIDRAFT_179491 [Pseudocercospora fijiensis CIRAD86]